MNLLRNRVSLIGNLGADPEIKELEGGKKFAKFSVATAEAFRNQEGELIKNTQWHKLVAWGPRATFAEKYLKKGFEVAIEGKLNHRTYDDTDGNKKFFTEVVVTDILMLRTPKA